LENFIVWLESQGYQRFTIRRHVCEVVHFAHWAEAEGLALCDLNRGALPISRQAGGQTVARAIRCTGISAPTKGSHLLRHSAATRLLREGVSLPAISALLRHASIETTTVYAKVDVDLLQEVAMPWPEEGEAMLTNSVKIYLSVRQALGFKLQSVEKSACSCRSVLASFSPDCSVATMLVAPHHSGLPAPCPAENSPYPLFSSDAFTEYLQKASS
jgi:Phage integrase family